jgi:hypothetical protein
MILHKIFNKLFVKIWTLGICQGNIQDVIRSKSLSYKINWLWKVSFDKFDADPFILNVKDGNYEIIYEDFSFSDDYANISLMTLDENFRQIKQKIVLDTKSHLSYPFVFKENDRIYIFPEAGKSGKLTCYEYDQKSESLHFLKDILEIPLLDSTIIKYNDKYWIFGLLYEKGKSDKLSIFHSYSLLGPYTPHQSNPVKKGTNSTRPAGNFIEVDGIIYRPSQNCKTEYGESITINKVIELSETIFIEEPYMNIVIGKKDNEKYRMQTIHTINGMDNIIVVDGAQWTFAPFHQFKRFIGSFIRLYHTKNKTVY